MTSRERMLIAINNSKPDRLPGQVHGWMPYYLNTYLGGCDQFEAYERFDLDMAIYIDPIYIYDEKDLANWCVERTDLGTAPDGTFSWVDTITTPEGTLRSAGSGNPITSWLTEPLIKSEADFEIFDKYYPVPCRVDGTPVRKALERVGDRGIVRGCLWGYGQSGPWQSFCCLVDTQPAIMYAMDNPDWVRYVEERLLAKQLRVIEMMAGEVPYDLVEIGGGAGSNTVISPKMHEEFCLPYDRRQVEALHEAGYKVVYHLCGGLMKMLDYVVANGSDGLETMTPPSMGGDCDLAECNRRVGDKLFFVGGFDQNHGFEHGTPETVRQMVFELHAACPDGGYICSPSDHFFHGDPRNIQAFADALKECVY
ncbi:MAG: uroporphyrinogen decarboxylase family protein [Armatimonadota bacterium]